MGFLTVRHMKKEKIFIYGKHAVMEAILGAPQSIKKIFFSEKGDEEMEVLARERNIPISKTLEGANKNENSHQGFFASIDVGSLVLRDSDLLKKEKDRKSFSSLVYLDGVQDPQNVGAIIRSAAAFGMNAVVIPEKFQAGITGGVAKSSSGMIFRVPIVLLNDPINSILNLKKEGFVVYGMDGESREDIEKVNFNKKSLFVMGNEALGIGNEIVKLCDQMISIKMEKACESLNVAVAAGIAFYELKKSRDENNT